MPTTDTTTVPATRLDWLLAWVAIILTASLMALPLSVTPTFRVMIEDVDGPLPLLTSWVFDGILPWVGALPPTGLLVAAARMRQPTPHRRRLVLFAAATLAFIAMALCLFGYAAPVFGAVDNLPPS